MDSILSQPTWLHQIFHELVPEAGQLPFQENIARIESHGVIYGASALEPLCSGLIGVMSRLRNILHGWHQPHRDQKSWLLTAFGPGIITAISATRLDEVLYNLVFYNWCHVKTLHYNLLHLMSGSECKSVHGYGRCCSSENYLKSYGTS